MRLPRFHVPDAAAGLPAGASLALPPGAAHHAARVLRLGPGDALVVFSGAGGEYRARIDSVAGARVRVRLESWQDVDRAPATELAVEQALAAADRLDFVLEKSVELGIASFGAHAAARSVVRLEPARAAKRLQHWRGLAASACEQCGLNRLPQLLPVATFAGMLGRASGLRVLLVPDAGQALAEVVASAAAGRVTLAVGPEGGYTADERSAARVAGFREASLGPRVLRTETAALAALAAIHAWRGDFTRTPEPR